MAGYIFSLDSVAALRNYVTKGLRRRTSHGNSRVRPWRQAEPEQARKIAQPRPRGARWRRQAAAPGLCETAVGMQCETCSPFGSALDRTFKRQVVQSGWLMGGCRAAMHRVRRFLSSSATRSSSGNSSLSTTSGSPWSNR